MNYNYVIIGNSVAAVGAIEAIRSVDSTGTLAVIALEKHHAYSRPLITHYLCDEVDDELLSNPAIKNKIHPERTLLGWTSMAYN